MATTIDIAKDLFCGLLSGWGQVFTMVPFENIKLKIVIKPLEYPTYLEALRKTIAEEGLLSLYKGMLMPLCGVGGQVAVQFGIVETSKKILRVNYADEQGVLPIKYSFLSGIFAGVPSAFVMAPLDHARFRVVLNKEKGMGSVKKAIEIYRQHGIRKLYLGFNSHALRDTVGLCTYFGVYDFLIRRLGSNSVGWSLLAGGTTGVLSWLLSYPIDYVKSQIQSDSLTNPRFKSAIHCMLEESKKGYLVFYKGLQIMLARAFVVNATGFMCFQIGKKMLYDKAGETDSA